MGKGYVLPSNCILSLNLNLSLAHETSAFFRIAADGGANRLSDAFKDPCLNEDFEKIVRTQGQILSIYSRLPCRTNIP